MIRSLLLAQYHQHGALRIVAALGIGLALLWFVMALPGIYG